MNSRPLPSPTFRSVSPISSFAWPRFSPRASPPRQTLSEFERARSPNAHSSQKVTSRDRGVGVGGERGDGEENRSQVRRERAVRASERASRLRTLELTRTRSNVCTTRLSKQNRRGLWPPPLGGRCLRVFQARVVVPRAPRVEVRRRPVQVRHGGRGHSRGVESHPQHLELRLQEVLHLDAQRPLQLEPFDVWRERKRERVSDGGGGARGHDSGRSSYRASQ